MKQKSVGQRISFGFAIASYIGAVICLVMAVIKGLELGTQNATVTSFAASVVFFIGCGVVLHVIGTINMPSFKL